MSVSSDPRGAIISQWLVTTQEAVSQGNASEEEEEQREGMVGIYGRMIEGTSAVHQE